MTLLGVLFEEDKITNFLLISTILYCGPCSSRALNEEIQKAILNNANVTYLIR